MYNGTCPAWAPARQGEERSRRSPSIPCDMPSELPSAAHRRPDRLPCAERPAITMSNSGRITPCPFPDPADHHLAPSCRLLIRPPPAPCSTAVESAPARPSSMTSPCEQHTPRRPLLATGRSMPSRPRRPITLRAAHRGVGDGCSGPLGEPEPFLHEPLIDQMHDARRASR